MAAKQKRGGGSGSTQLSRWEPFREIQEMRDRMERLMQAFWSGMPAPDGDAWSPIADIEETKDAWLVKAELPGVKPGDIKVEIRDHTLEISGERKEEEQREGEVRRQMRRMGRFEYRATLPPEADTEHVDASLDAGVLTVRVPRTEAPKPRQIPIKAG
ncbi:MAG TPA: Hsp20/alpha crystallin family protein [Thermodesulfobacteriota bacterium]|jgi:HSP20 family protein